MNLNDIINRLRDADERNEQLPLFVADAYSSMPPASGYEVLAEHLVHLMEELQGLKSQVGILRDSHVGGYGQQDMRDVREELHDIKSVLLKNSAARQHPSAGNAHPLSYSAVLGKQQKSAQPNRRVSALIGDAGSSKTVESTVSPEGIVPSKNQKEAARVLERGK